MRLLMRGRVWACTLGALRVLALTMVVLAIPPAVSRVSEVVGSLEAQPVLGPMTPGQGPLLPEARPSAGLRMAPGPMTQMYLSLAVPTVGMLVLCCVFACMVHGRWGMRWVRCCVHPRENRNA